SFEKDKQKDISFINIFDDLIIFSSVVTYPLINGLQWFSYYTENNKHKFVTTLYVIIPVWIIYYVLWLAVINVEIKTINDDIDILLKDQKSQIIENYEDKVEGDEADDYKDKSIKINDKKNVKDYSLKAQNSEAVKIQSSEMKKNNEIKARDKKLIIIDLAIVRNKIIMAFVSLQDFYKKINLGNKPNKDLKTEQIMINIEKNSTKTKIEIKEEILNLLEDFEDFGDHEDDEQVKEISV
ncbi:17529_t:CDS:2, partial [Cetraspora pellucida]